ALFTGDITKRAEKNLMIKYREHLKATLLKIAHHGSKTATTSAFVEIIDPDLATIGVGREHQYGFPHKETLARLQAQGTKVLRTDLEGGTGVIVNEGVVKTFATKRRH
ncbi:MAG TPA: hypothetical protein VJC18_11025, partial [bacterium]|nr:hypothetical protein [bacterium]